MNNKLSKLVGGLLLVLLVLCITSLSLSAENGGKEKYSGYEFDPENLTVEEKELLDERTREFEEIWYDIQEKKAKILENRKRVEKVSDNDKKNAYKKEISELEQKLKALENKLKNRGFEKKTLNKPENDFSISSVNSDIVTSVSMYYDQWTEYWILQGTNQWQNENWLNDTSTAFDSYIGERDGLAVQVSEQIAVYSDAFYARYSDGETTPEAELNIFPDRYNHGYSWEFSDKKETHCDDDPYGDCYWAFNTDYVAGSIYFKFTYGEPSDTIVSFEAEYKHTWDEAEIDSISVSNTGASISVTVESKSNEDEDYGNKEF